MGVANPHHRACTGLVYTNFALDILFVIGLCTLRCSTCTSWFLLFAVSTTSLCMSLRAALVWKILVFLLFVVFPQRHGYACSKAPSASLAGPCPTGLVSAQDWCASFGLFATGEHLPDSVDASFQRPWLFADHQKKLWRSKRIRHGGALHVML